MPPLVHRKRHRSPAPLAPKSSPTKPPASSSRKKETLFETAATSLRPVSTVEENEAYLEGLHAGGYEYDASSDSDEFEDALPEEPAFKRRKIQKRQQDFDEDDQSSDEEMDWEEVQQQPEAPNEPAISGDLELTLEELPETSVGYPKQAGKRTGPSKKQRQVRHSTHCMHVQALLFHNLIRNGWACDKDAQKSLVDGLPVGIRNEVEKWRVQCGLTSGEEKVEDAKEENTKDTNRKSKQKGKGGREANERDWSAKAAQQVHETSTVTQADSTVKLLKVLAAYWRKRFTITAPGLRKDGWKDTRRLAKEVESFRNSKHDPEEHGERVRSRREFRAQAKRCEGSRDLGSQLFTALLRGLGLETRLVASLQPLGFAFTKNEEASPAKRRTSKATASSTGTKENNRDSDLEMLDGPPSKKQETKQSGPKANTKTRSGGDKSRPIDLSDESSLSDAPDSDIDSLIDITPPTPMTSVCKYDRDLQYPHYWTEVLSVTHQIWIPVETLVLSVVAINDELLAQFEPRGAKAEMAKQVLCYVVAYSSDGTAKDVTTRYLKKHQWPGRTRGFRLPIEKVPVYKKNGKIAHHTENDWFKHVMRLYERPSSMRTAADDIEDARELVPVRATRERKAGEEDVLTLQSLKTSAEFVLERHLRREEAFVLHAEPVKTFTTGKGENAKDEPVFLRKDVVSCKTVESWHKDGREVKEGEQPLKMVPFRAVTTIRKRELEEAERASGEKMKQGLYSRAQTDWIIPPPIENGIIPRNSYGNMDVYVPSMVPKGAIHIPLRGTMKVCKKLGIDFAEACTGFEFGHRMAVPVLTGVVVARENEDLVIDAWEAEEQIKRKKEKEKREKTALTMWKKMLSGLRIVERVKRQYGDQANSHMVEAFRSMTAADGKQGKKGRTVKRNIETAEAADDASLTTHAMNSDDLTGGGFLPSDAGSVGGGFFVEDVDEDDAEARDNAEDTPIGGGFFLDGADEHMDKDPMLKSTSAATPARTPISLQSLHQSNTDSSELSAVEDNESVVQAPRSKSAPRNKNASSGRKSTSTRGSSAKSRKSKLKAELTPPDSLEDEDAADGGERKEVASRSTRKAEDSKPIQGGSKRTTARKSAEKVRSHYFEASDDE